MISTDTYERNIVRSNGFYSFEELKSLENDQIDKRIKESPKFRSEKELRKLIGEEWYKRCNATRKH